MAERLSMLGQNCAIAKDVKVVHMLLCQMCDINSTSTVGGMPWPQIGVTHYHAQLELPDKGRAIKRFFVCYVVCLGYIIYRIKVRGSGPLMWSGWLSSLSTARLHRYRCISQVEKFSIYLGYGFIFFRWCFHSF